jgi:dTDP-glucose 4,6-dehydratase
LPGGPEHRPSSPYAASKAAQEDLVYAWQRTYEIPSTIVTSANMFGERQSLLAYIPKVIGAVLYGQQLPIHTWRGQPGARRYTYVGNTAQAIVEHLTARGEVASARPPHRLLRRTLPGQHRIDNLALAQQIAGLIGQPLRYQPVDGPAVRPGYDPDYGPLVGDAGWASFSFTDGLERTVKWFVDHPEWLK